ncbi:MAG: class I SAM-dependent methyltransferase [Candidatus Altiarchaeota archaeon]
MTKKVHPSFNLPENLVKNQQKVWDRDYRLRGRIWSKERKDLPHGLCGGVVLEAGVGNGKTLKAILRREPRSVHAFDHSQEALKLCREGFKDPRIALEKADIRALPYRDSGFDAAVVHFILDNLQEGGRKEAVREVFRVLKPGGALYFSDFSVGDFRQATANIRIVLERNTHLKKSGLICHFFEEEEVHALLDAFTDVEVKTNEYPPIRNKGHLKRKTIDATAKKPPA